MLLFIFSIKLKLLVKVKNYYFAHKIFHFNVIHIIYNVRAHKHAHTYAHTNTK